MGRGTVRYAAVRSLNDFELQFPYAGAQRATLYLRVAPKKIRSNPGDFNKDVILEIEHGQFLIRPYEEVTARFDDGEALRFHATELADQRTTAILIAPGDYARFVTKLRKAKTCRIEALFYQAGTRVLQFDVSGLKWSDFAPEEAPHMLD